MSGEVGRFNIDGVMLGNWVIGDQSANKLIEGVDFRVAFAGDTYTIQPVPIPSAILLLGGGLVSLIAVRRRRSS